MNSSKESRFIFRSSFSHEPGSSDFKLVAAVLWRPAAREPAAARKCEHGGIH